MKKNIYIGQLFAMLVVLCGLSACEKNSFLEQFDESNVSQIFTSRGNSCEITTTRVGQVDSLLRDKAEKEDFDIKQITSLAISGPIGYEDVEAIQKNVSLELLDLTGCLFYRTRIWDNYSFYYPNSWKKESNPKQVASVPFAFFYRFNSATKVLLPSYITAIEDGAFYESGLAAVEIPVSVKSIGSDAFKYCYSLQEVYLPEGVEIIGDYAFANSGVRLLTVPSTVSEVGELILDENYDAAAVVWNSLLEIPELYYFYDFRPQPLIFTLEGVAISESSYNENIIRGSHANYICLQSNHIPYIVRPFTADYVVYSQWFPIDQEEDVGGNGNWQTIVLPFTPTEFRMSLYGEKHEYYYALWPGAPIAPFNSSKEHFSSFWLRELTPNGFVDVTEMEPYKPYIIAVPNSKKYKDEYNIRGSVFFYGENVSFPPSSASSSVWGEYEFIPTYDYVPKTDQILILNDDWYDDCPPGSMFIPANRDVLPLEAYIKAPSATRSVLPISSVTKRTRSAHIVDSIPSICDK